MPVVCSAASVEPGDIRIDDVGALRAAVGQMGATSDMARMAGRADVDVIEAALGGEDPTSVRTALSLVCHMEHPEAFLPALVELASSNDRDIASRAAHAAALVTARADLGPAGTCVDRQCDLVELGELMTGALSEALGEDGIAPDVKKDLLAMLATDAGRAYVPAVRDEVTDLLGSDDPSIRVAAATLMTPPLDEDMLEELLDAAADDDDASVVGACLLAACAAMSLPEGKDERKTFEKRVARFSRMEPSADHAAPLASCLAGLGEPWAEALAAGLPGPKEPL